MSLEIGLQKTLLIREEAIDLRLGRVLLYASDLHLRSGQGHAVCLELLNAARALQPAVILLGGDLVDVPSALPILGQLVSSLQLIAPVGAVAGNHDALVGLEKVRRVTTGAGAIWLEDEAMEIGSMPIVGSVKLAPLSGPWILCAHYPTVFPGARRAGARVVLAGHLHGWQIVLGQWREYLLPGALLSRWNGPRFEREGSTLLVSRGVTDLLPLRWNCPREVLAVWL